MLYMTVVAIGLIQCVMEYEQNQNLTLGSNLKSFVEILKLQSPSLPVQRDVSVNSVHMNKT
jgi:hypothetical protein